ncbi:Central glycolyticproteinregulator [Liquorilactobacillus sucicola DSM 21376 = JCM 15457]|uniref:Central glycolyticproteinregulator n=2 Tax=Liquorilactobacillus sucicola TaxID=519050 RepID=A0A0R2DY63_9LACO|nr:Central glycolyticproteinregulator [Liquorilactobacillus sucicola DSM 21376 = JCM 15457]
MGRFVTPMDESSPARKGRKMHQELEWIEKIAPDMVETMVQRFMIMRHIYWSGPIGRRLLAQEMGVTERVLRTETDFLKRQGLITSTKSGMVITEEGKAVIHKLRGLMDQLAGIQRREKRLSEFLGIDRCLIVSGDCDEQVKVIETMGKLVNDTLQTLLPEGRNVIAVMGGTTMARIAARLTPRIAEKRELLFVPARGGVGEAVDIQANSVSAQMALRTGGKHRTLYVPEQLSEKAYAPLMQEPSILEVVQLIRNSNAVIHSIGEAITMAKRRDMSKASIAELKREHAVGEAFGYFFDEEGRVVYKIPRVGLQLEDLANMKSVIAVAGGTSKAKAIVAYMKLAPKQTCLITDEGAAKVILKE